jgi:DNA segregation ATPase FtsK/SpoIIIE, S-DNA-T family
MHTVVFGWFGVSVIWFAPLLIRLAIAALTRDGETRGRGTIRLWLGFVGVFVGSGALEAALAPQTGNALGHAFFGVAMRALGRGAFFLLPVLVLASLPWLIGFRWRDVLRWADRTFGLGLNLRPAASPSSSSPSGAAAGGRVDEPRLARGLGSAAVRTSTSAVNAMAPKSTGRYARPTPWQPPPVSIAKTRPGTPVASANPHDVRAASGKSFDPVAMGRAPRLGRRATRPGPAAAGGRQQAYRFRRARPIRRAASRRRDGKTRGPRRLRLPEQGLARSPRSRSRVRRPASRRATAPIPHRALPARQRRTRMPRRALRRISVNRSGGRASPEAPLRGD